ncbi:MAG: anthranilate phosphoribosyltransferase, partial [Actinomycetota bacterium]
ASKLFAGEQFENSRAVFDVVVLNAAGGIAAYDLAKGSTLDLPHLMETAIKRSKEAIESGAAKQKLVQWSAVTQQL